MPRNLPFEKNSSGQYVFTGEGTTFVRVIALAKELPEVAAGGEITLFFGECCVPVKHNTKPGETVRSFGPAVNWQQVREQMGPVLRTH